jgi:hypothetical protein
MLNLLFCSLWVNKSIIVIQIMFDECMYLKSNYSYFVWLSVVTGKQHSGSEIYQWL